MADENRTEYVNGEKNTEQEEPVHSGIDCLRTEYVGSPSNQTTHPVNQTEYVGRESKIKTEIEESHTEYVGKPTTDRDDDLQREVKAEPSDVTSNPATTDDSNEPLEEPEPEFDRSVHDISSNDSASDGGKEGIEEPVSYYLPTNTMLQKRYRINSVIGEGGFGITYSGWDITLNAPVAIKEYYPSGLVTRSVTLGKTTQVVPLSQAKYGNQFRDGIDRVLDEARRTAKFRNTPGIVGIYDFFEANNTAYIVLEYVDGVTLDVYCKNNRVDNTTLFNMLVPVMDALQALHKEGIIHRDISPDNIMVDKDGNTKLLDFGAARGYTEDGSSTMSVILKKSYAPEEQFRAKGKQGPWTDIYALGATIYELITGQTPPNSIDRLVEDEIVDIQELTPSLTRAQAYAIMKALSVKASDRWQSIHEFKTSLLADDYVPKKQPIETSDKQQANKTGDDHNKRRFQSKPERNRVVLVSVIAIFSILLIIFLWNQITGSEKNDKDSSSTPNTSEIKQGSSAENTNNTINDSENADSETVDYALLYENAMVLLAENHNYAAAQNLFSDCGSYENAEDYVRVCKLYSRLDESARGVIYQGSNVVANASTSAYSLARAYEAISKLSSVITIQDVCNEFPFFDFYVKNLDGTSWEGERGTIIIETGNLINGSSTRMLMYYDGKWGIGDNYNFEPIEIDANNEYIHYSGSKYYHK